MSTEAGLWKLIRNSKPRGHWVRVENRVERGTPDVNFCLDEEHEGWLELKTVSQWPKRNGPLRVPHFTRQQRWWLKRRAWAGGSVGLLLRVDSGPKEYLLLDGSWAAIYLGDVEREVLIDNSLSTWGPHFDPDEFLRGINLL